MVVAGLAGWSHAGCPHRAELLLVRCVVTRPVSELHHEGRPDLGVADEEAAFAYSGFVPAKLGPRVLRTETAALAALAALNALRSHPDLEFVLEEDDVIVYKRR